MLLKGLGIGIILTASSWFGYSLSHDYLMRLRNLEQFNKMLMLLKGEIKYNNSGINEAMIKIASQTDSVLGKFLEQVWNILNKGDNSLKEAWDKGVEETLVNKTALKQEDIGVIKELGINLGITDRETQINNILNTMDVIGVKIKELNETRGEKCKLYRTLGIMAGVFMAIVLI